MTDRDRADMAALCDHFRRDMGRENEVLLYDQEAKQRFGQMIGQAVRKGNSEFGYLRRRG
jgi:hypothetical protein